MTGHDDAGTMRGASRTGRLREPTDMEAHVLALGAEAAAGRIATRPRYDEPEFDDALSSMGPMLAADLGHARLADLTATLVRMASETTLPARVSGEPAEAVFRVFALPVHGRASAIREVATSPGVRLGLVDAIWGAGLAHPGSNALLFGHAVEMGALAAATPGRVNAMACLLADAFADPDDCPPGRVARIVGRCLGPDVTGIDVPESDPVGNFGLVGLYVTTRVPGVAPPVDRFGGLGPFRHGGAVPMQDRHPAWVDLVRDMPILRRCLVGMPESLPDAVDFLGSCHLGTAVKALSAHLGLRAGDRFDVLHVCREGGGLTLRIASAGAVAGPVTLPASVADPPRPYVEGALSALAARADLVREHPTVDGMPAIGVGTEGHVRPN